MEMAHNVRHPSISKESSTYLLRRNENPNLFDCLSELVGVDITAVIHVEVLESFLKQGLFRLVTGGFLWQLILQFFLKTAILKVNMSNGHH